MFNLIVSGGGWQHDRDTFRRDRVFEYTSAEIVKRFTVNNTPDIERLVELPTVFMQEDGVASEDARLGRITRIRENGQKYELQYVYDPVIPPIPNAKIEKMAGELGIGDWEFTRTHWAIKDVDLFYVLLRHNQPSKPKVFDLSVNQIDVNRVAVMMPFTGEFDSVYSALINAMEPLGKKCQRADDIWKHDAVIQDIVALICTSRVVICDLSKRNPNVFYEAGIGHTLGKDVILITQSDEDVPFNLRHLRYIKYVNDIEGCRDLGERVRRRIETLD